MDRKGRRGAIAEAGMQKAAGPAACSVMGMASQEGFEPPTPRLEGACSIQLSYWEKLFNEVFPKHLIRLRRRSFVLPPLRSFHSHPKIPRIRVLRDLCLHRGHLPVHTCSFARAYPRKHRANNGMLQTLTHHTEYERQFVCRKLVLEYLDSEGSCIRGIVPSIENPMLRSV